MLQNPDVSQPAQNYKWSTPKKGKLRIMPISDSPWAPTGFGTNTKNVSAILTKDGHHIGYGGCQNRSHIPFDIPWPLNQDKRCRLLRIYQYNMLVKKDMERNLFLVGCQILDLI